MAQSNQQQSVWSVDSSPPIQSITLANLRKLPQIENFSEEQIFEMEVVGNVLPFKANNYVIEQLIDWNNVPGDSMFNLTFPQKHMLKSEHYDMMASVLKNNPDRKEIQETANKIRLQLNPHPAGQMELNVPVLKMEPNFMECNTNTTKPVFSSLVKVKLVMHIVAFVLDGHNLLEWMK